MTNYLSITSAAFDNIKVVCTKVDPIADQRNFRYKYLQNGEEN